MSMYSLLLKILMTQAIRRSAILILYGIPFQTKSKWIQISVDCELLLGRNVDEEQVICDPCKKLQKNILVQQNRKKRSSSAPAKAKAPLTACSSEKRKVTVVATRLECKQPEDKIKKRAE